VRKLLVSLMMANAALFVLGAVLHAGIRLGELQEPRIIPATIVESLCAITLFGGALAIFQRGTRAWRAGLIVNIVALCGVLLGIAALALGAGPWTRTNDLYHRCMLALIGASLVLLFLQSRRHRHRRRYRRTLSV
jgi:uncharacterized membrane protein YfcA